VQGSQSTARSLRVQSQQLPTESQVFEHEIRPATERTDQPAQEMPERHDHGKNFSGKDRIKLCAKSLISQVYDLLPRQSGGVADSFDSFGESSERELKFAAFLAGQG
jgi:hypothetical protein